MSTPPHNRNFLGLDARFSDFEAARVAVLPLPYEATCSYGLGTSKGPDAILDASAQVELWDEELDRQTYRIGVATVAPVPAAKSSPDAEVERIYTAARELGEAGKFVLGLGGEHTVSYGLIRSLMERHGRLSVLQIDAHLDLRDEYDGTRFSHASVMRRVSELGATIVCCGARAFSREEWDYAGTHDVSVFLGRVIGHSSEFVADAVAALEGPVYVTIDVDGLDPSIMPSTGTPEPGGLLYWQVLDLLRAVGETHQVVGCDVVELAPDGVNHHSELLAARLGYKMLGYFVGDPDGNA